MEWLLIIGALWLGGYIWKGYQEGKAKRVSQKLRHEHNKTGVAAYQRLLDKAEPVKLNVEKADVESVRLSGEQKAVYEIIENTHYNAYITGKAGTGKSLLLEYFVSHTKKTVAVVAPTGIAALNVGGMTIHSFFKFPPDVIDLQEINVDYKTREILRNIDAIIIDEVSMIRVDLMEGMNVKLQMARRNDQPFGGVQMIMFGDLYQLPPVVSDGQLHRYFNHTYGGVYFFSAPVFEKSQLKIYELNKIFRQKDPEFRNVLNSIRNGDNSPEVLETINMRARFEIPEVGLVTLAGTNSTVSSINHKKLAQLDGIERTYEATIAGDIKAAAFPTEKLLKLKPGAQIMMLKNDQEKPRRWVNGTLGIVTKLSADTIRINIDGVEHSVSRETWNKFRYSYDHEKKSLEKEIVSSFTQFPVRLAWAITIHKSQGQTYQSVAVDLSDGAFAHGQTYVALSRCVSLNGLYLKTKVRPEDIIIDQEIVEFMRQAEVLNTD